MTSMIELEGVTKAYGNEIALGPVDLVVPEGGVGLLGPNGAGKTTMLRILLGLMRPTSGTVKVLGDDVQQAGRALRRRIGYVPEGEAVFPRISGIESVAYAGELVGMTRVDAVKRAHEVLDYIGLDEARYRSADGYSTGMKQRLKLAQALVHDPELLVLDEPTEGVDPEAREQLLALLSSLAREHGMRMILSTHLLADVERLATHAIVLNHGKVAAHGTLEELKRAQTTAYDVRVNGAVTPLTEALDAQHIKWEMHAPAVRVQLDDPRAVLKLVKDAGLVVRHLAPATLTLEEAFERAVSETEVSASG